jgi:hypothetical protein
MVDPVDVGQAVERSHATQGRRYVTFREASGRLTPVSAARLRLMLLLMTFRRPEINRVSVVPIYEQLEAAIAGQIESGVLAPGEKLPGDQDLAADLGIGYQTVRRVMLGGLGGTNGETRR